MNAALLAGARLAQQRSSIIPSLGLAAAYDFVQGADPQVLYDTSVAGKNLLSNPEDLSSAAWIKAGGGVGTAPVVTPGAELAPDGTLSASRIVFDIASGTASGDLSQLSGVGSAPVYGEAATSTWLRTTDGSTVQMVLSPHSGTIAYITLTPTWTRFSVTGNVPAGGALGFRLRLRGSEATAKRAEVALWHPMFNAGATALPYEHSPLNGQLGSLAGTDANDPVWGPQGLVFDGTAKFATFPPAIPAPQVQITMTAVVTLTGDNGGGYHGLLSGITGSGRYPRMLVANGGSTVLVQRASGSMSHVTGLLPTIANGTPTLYAATYDGAVSRIYVNGTLVSELAMASSLVYSSAGKGYLGSGADTATYFLNGVMHHAAIYTRALTEPEVGRTYRALKKRLASRGVAL